MKLKKKESLLFPIQCTWEHLGYFSFTCALSGSLEPLFYFVVNGFALFTQLQKRCVKIDEGVGFSWLKWTWGSKTLPSKEQTLKITWHCINVYVCVYAQTHTHTLLFCAKILLYFSLNIKST